MQLIQSIFKLPRPFKRLVTLCVDTFFIVSAFWMSFIVRLDTYLVVYEKNYWVLLAFVLPVTLFVFIRLGLYRAVLRYMGPKAALAIAIGVAVSVLALVLASFYSQAAIPRTVPLIYAAFLLILAGGSRFFVRSIVMFPRSRGRERVVIYGAGESGRQLATALMQGNEFNPVAFIDDDKNLQGTFVYGKPIYSFELFAIANISAEKRSKIIAKLEPLAVEVMSIPSSDALVNGDATIDQLQDVAIEDLLGRDQVEPNQKLLQKNITNKVVLVTGAGGSIGAELCRQIVAQKPSKLLLFEFSEYALYSIFSELSALLKQQNSATQVFSICGNVQNYRDVYNVLKGFKVNTVYHTAAFKHVPLVEYNVLAGIKNNILGTKRTAQAAIDAGVDTFVLISTDKAVRPTNIMGATKRTAELCLQALAKDQESKLKEGKIIHKTIFGMVRFGNVLGSSGSVVPLFREQISKGGPVTVTDREIIRYFMTIPEASQLVIQAGALAKGGDVFLLDMGEPVKIYDLAIKMVHLMGLQIKDDNNPEGDIEIKFSGLRPGEKLYEELLVGDNAFGTQHPRIMGSNEVSLSYKKMQEYLSLMEQYCQNNQVEEAVKLLEKMPTGYKPNSDLCDNTWLATKEKSTAEIIPFEKKPL